MTEIGTQEPIKSPRGAAVVFKVAALLWWIWAAWLLLYGWTRPAEFWLVTYGPPVFVYLYGGSLWFRSRAAIWLGALLLLILVASGVVNGYVHWRVFQVLLAGQLAFVLFSLVFRSALSNS